MEAYRDKQREAVLYEQQLLRPTAFETIAERGKLKLMIYKRGAQDYMQYCDERPRNWFSGVVHRHDGTMTPAKDYIASGEGIAISQVQAAYMRHKQRPEPESDPHALSDWITPSAAAIRKAEGIASAHARNREKILRSTDF